MVDAAMSQDACFSWNCIWNPGCEFGCSTHDKNLMLGMVEITWCGCLKKDGLSTIQGQHKVLHQVSKQPEADLIVKQLLPTHTLWIQCLGSETMFWIQGDLFRSPAPGQKSWACTRYTSEAAETFPGDKRMLPHSLLLSSCYQFTPHYWK